ncbi:N5-glutamine methyltransferase family protein [Cohnella hongkongensis]|uniref:Release factor glutamine methyltransferase n=1 Tax=Cohnella hongkongensis TaxID=178337 RepID=A0ABV9FCR7_9BACL
MSLEREAGRPPTLGEAWRAGAERLGHAGVEEANADAELLLLHALGIGKAELLRDWREPFPEEKSKAWSELLERRETGVPVQYVVGEQHFYGRAFEVTEAVLIPRPETELLAEAVLKAGDLIWPETGSAASGQVEQPERERETSERRSPHLIRSEVGGSANEQFEEPERERGATEWRSPDLIRSEVGVGANEQFEKPERERQTSSFDAEKLSGGRDAPRPAPVVLDVGTGSGALAVTLAAERPLWRVTASDLSEAALQVARGNARKHGVDGRISFVQGDLLQLFLTSAAGGGLAVDILVSNPPYIPSSDIPGLQREVRDHEPRLALDGGEDGLNPYRTMVRQLKELPRLPRIVAWEVGAGQARDVAELLREAADWTEIHFVLDYAGIERHVVAVR